MRATPIVSLHAPAQIDASDIFEAVRESATELSPWMPWCASGYSRDDAEAWVSMSEDARKAGNAFEFVIRAADGRLMGCCGLNHIRPDDRFANLGYWVRTSETGQGVATAAVRLLVTWGFGNTDLERFEIMPAVTNLRSQRVAEASGAHREGVLRNRLLLGDVFHDAVMYSIVRSSWGPA